MAWPETKCCAISRHYERALLTIIANPTKAADYAQSALDMGTA